METLKSIILDFQELYGIIQDVSAHDRTDLSECGTRTHRDSCWRLWILNGWVLNLVAMVKQLFLDHANVGSHHASWGHCAPKRFSGSIADKAVLMGGGDKAYDSGGREVIDSECWIRHPWADSEGPVSF